MGPGSATFRTITTTSSRTALPYLFVPLILLVVAALAWSWWTARADRDPASSVDHFNRALSAMEPRERPSGRPPTPDQDRPAPRDDDPSRDA